MSVWAYIVVGAAGAVMGFFVFRRRQRKHKFMDESEALAILRTTEDADLFVRTVLEWDLSSEERMEAILGRLNNLPLDYDQLYEFFEYAPEGLLRKELAQKLAFQVLSGARNGFYDRRDKAYVLPEVDVEVLLECGATEIEDPSANEGWFHLTLQYGGKIFQGDVLGHRYRKITAARRAS